ncbi:hypothetical protein WN51_00798 [Melipona quadrifasciata]|uniref:Uncharacterized protein n=1 Tax=Melipona quadrifasciata TaxID=166423 RepID=A0A0N0U4Z8_9HYME|nr:hypothetical protein WN51_00798 [Melipona quadrifasciata]
MVRQGVNANSRPSEQDTINRIDSNAFLPLYNLHTLEPSKNRLQRLGAQLFNWPFVLNRLTLSANVIATLNPLAFRDCSNLKELNLGKNEQATVPDAPRDLALLKTLNHGENRGAVFTTNDAGGFLVANCGKQQQQQQDEYITSDNEILGSSHSIEIPQTPHLLNQTSHENNVTVETLTFTTRCPASTRRRRNSRLTKHCRRRASEQEHLRTGRFGDPYCDLVGEHESIRGEP